MADTTLGLVSEDTHAYGQRAIGHASRSNRQSQAFLGPEMPGLPDTFFPDDGRIVPSLRSPQMRTK